MFRNKSVLFLIILGFSATSLAASPWDQSNTPVQVFRQAGDIIATNSSAMPKKAPESKAIAASHTELAQNAQPATVSSPDSNASGAAGLTTLQNQLVALNQNAIVFQEAANNKINRLSNQVQVLQQQLQQVNHAMLLLNQEVKKLSPPVMATASPKLPEVVHVPTPLENLTNIILWAIAIIIILALLALIWARRPKAKSVPATHSAPKVNDHHDDTEGEYDYMGSQESIPAKLNLVRAYIAMENYDDARKVIAEVLSHGDELQCHEAQDLGKKIPNETQAYGS